MPGPLPQEVRTRRDVDDFLAAATNYEEKLPVSPRAFDLRRMAALLRAAGDPHRDPHSDPNGGPRTVHVAGSKGKGSVARMTDAILRAAGGGPVGLYTSPHLFDLSERIAVDGVPASEGALVRAVGRLYDHVASVQGTQAAPTFFEVLTAAAWLVFREAGCADVVLEVGLGGRLDATNVCVPAATAITSIELEHTALLGGTVEEIAWEKAGILKPGVFAVTATDGAALAVIEARARDVDAPLTILGRDLVLERCVTGPGPKTDARVSFRERTLDLTMPVAGVHQGSNAALAAAMALDLGVPEAAIVRGLASLSLPGTLEVVSTDPLVVVDGAHTPVSAARTREAVAACWPGRPVTLVLGVLSEKDVRGVASAVCRDVAHVVVTQPASPRAMSAHDLAHVVSGLTHAPLSVESVPEDALRRATLLAGPSGLVLVSGSIYLAGQCRRTVPGTLVRNS